MVTDAQSNVPLSAEEGIRRLESSGALNALKEQGYQVLTPEPAVSVVQPTVAGTTSGESASARCMLTICVHAILCVTVVSGRAGRYVHMCTPRHMPTVQPWTAYSTTHAHTTFI